MGSSELKVVNEIKSVAESLILWFRNNFVKMNPDKFHLPRSNKKICDGEAFKHVSEKFLMIKIDNMLTKSALRQQFHF